MQSILEIKNGERIYQVVRSPWLKDDQGDVMFKMLSKINSTGDIEAAFVVERAGGYKTILGRTEVKEDQFFEVVAAFRSMVWQFFPNVDLAVEEIGPINENAKSNSQYTVAKNTKIGMFWLRLKKILRL